MKKKEEIKCNLMKAPPPNSSLSENNNREDNNILNGNKKPTASAVVTPAKQNVKVNNDVNKNREDKDNKANDIVIDASGLEKATKKNTDPLLFSKSMTDRKKK